MTSCPRHGAPPPAWQRLGRAAPRSGAAHRGHALSGTPCAHDDKSIVHAESEKAGEDCPDGGRDVARDYMSASPPEPRSLWQAAMRPRRSACPLRVGSAQGSRVASGGALTPV